jgi:YVTN family beta-propeller protein
MSFNGSFWTKRRALAGGSAAVVLAGGVVAGAALSGHSAVPAAAQHPASSKSVRLAASTCSGPAGAAYVADAGWDGFSAINTANCSIIQTYNVGDPPVPGDPGDQNYSSTDEAVALYQNTLYFADTGNDTVSVIDASTLDPKNYNPTETDIHVGFNPTYLAVTPNGSQLWVADTGPQTAPASPTDIKVISTATNKVTATLRLPSAPAQIAFSPSGASAYVTTAKGLVVYNTTTDVAAGSIGGLGNPHGVVVSPDGGTVYVTNTTQNVVEVIDAASNRVTGTIPVGQMPWQMALSSNGATLYVANPDSDSVSVISTKSGTVTHTVSLAGGPDTLALTPDGSQLWVGGLTSAIVSVLSTANLNVAGSVNLGGEGANSGDGFEPTGMALTATPTVGS